MSDHYSKKAMLFWGMLLQGIAILCIPFVHEFSILITISAILGFGTALVYPTFLATIAQSTKPKQRAESIGTFRLWRDLGYAIGALISGITADVFGVEYAIFLIGTITIASSVIIKYRMPKFIDIHPDCIKAMEVKKALLKHKNMMIIDVRSYEEYKLAHIPMASHIQMSELKEHVDQFDANVKIVTVCGKGGGRSQEAAEILKSYGLNAMWLCGGTNEWLSERL